MRKRGVGRPRGADPAETRREILRAAEETFAVSGFAGATTRQVAARAGVNVATLHYHFGNKATLYRTVLEGAMADAALSAPGGASAADRLGAAVSTLVDLVWSRPSLPRLFLLPRLAGTGGAGGTLEDARVAFLAQAITGAERAPRPAVETAGLVLGVLDVALVAARGADAGAAAPRDVRDAVVAAALRLLGPT